MLMVMLAFVVSVILAVLFHALIHNSIWASLATGIALLFFVRFLFGYHFPQISSFDFWIFSTFIIVLGFGVAFLVGRVIGKGKKSTESRK